MKNKTGKFSSVFIERALQCPLIFIASKSEWWLEKKPRKETERWGGVWKKWGGGGEEENKNLKKKSKCIISILYTRKEKALGPRRNEPNSRWNESRYVSGKELPVFSSGTSYKKIVSRRRRRRKKKTIILPHTHREKKKNGHYSVCILRCLYISKNVCKRLIYFRKKKKKNWRKDRTRVQFEEVGEKSSTKHGKIFFFFCVCVCVRGPWKRVNLFMRWNF